jgi:L-amino acid N-acyltransferase YncA
MDSTVEKMKDEDWGAVQAIYREGIATGNATFETDAPEWEEWNKSHLHDCRLVARVKDQVVGWAALSPVSSRCVYSGVAEVSIYVAALARGLGVGKALLRALTEESERAGIWTLQAGIFPENVASIALHKACGFREVGYRERIGRMNGVWRDVVFMERRSKVVGISCCHEG